MSIFMVVDLFVLLGLRKFSILFLCMLKVIWLMVWNVL